MNSRATTKSALAIAATFTLSVFCFTLFVWISFGGSVPFGPQGYRFNVQFGPEASNVFPNADVRISGVTVGEVAAVTTREGAVDAELELDERYAPMPSDAKAIVRSKTLLGEAYIELTPGSKTAPKIPEDGRLATANVDEAQGLDRALSAFDAPTREAFRDFLKGLGDAFEGRGADVNAALGTAPLATEDLRKLVDVLDRQRTAVRGLVADTGTALQTIGDRGSAAQGIARDGARVLGTTAARNDQLTATLDEVPRLMRSLRTFSADTIDISRAAAPALRDLRPVAGRLEPALREGRLLAPDLTTALRALDRTVTASEQGVPALTDTLKAAAPLLRVLDPAGQELVPVLKTVDAYSEDLVTSMANTAAATNSSYTRADGVKQNYLRALSHFTNELGYGATSRTGTHRENPFLRPGGFEALLKGGPLESISCADADKPGPPALGTGAPPCLQQKPFSLAGSPPSQYPRVPRDTSRAGG